MPLAFQKAIPTPAVKQPLPNKLPTTMPSKFGMVPMKPKALPQSLAPKFGFKPPTTLKPISPDAFKLSVLKKLGATKGFK